MSRIIKAWLTDSFADAAKLEGFVHSQFNSTCNIKFILPGGESRIVSLFPGGAAVPDSLMVEESFFKKISLLPVETRVFKHELLFYFRGIEEPLVGDARCLQSSFLCISEPFESPEKCTAIQNMSALLEALWQYRKESGKSDGFASLPENWRVMTISLLDDLADAFLETDLERICKIISHCVGIGKGLTPSSDDAIIGIIAVCTGVLTYMYPAVPGKLRREAAGSCFKEMLPFRMLENLTTDISLKYLCCALEGRFSDSLLGMIEALFEGKIADWRAHIEPVAETGSTSGMDMLAGVEAVIKRILRKYGIIDCENNTSGYEKEIRTII